MSMKMGKEHWQLDQILVVDLKGEQNSFVLEKAREKMSPQYKTLLNTLHLEEMIQKMTVQMNLPNTFDSIVTLEMTDDIQKILVLMDTLSKANIKVLGVRVSNSKNIELGLRNTSDKYKTLLIMESIGRI